MLKVGTSKTILQNLSFVVGDCPTLITAKVIIQKKYSRAKMFIQFVQN